MTIGVCASLVAAEPSRLAPIGGVAAALPFGRARGVIDAVAGPFVEFFRDVRAGSPS